MVLISPAGSPEGQPINRYGQAESPGSDRQVRQARAQEISQAGRQNDTQTVEATVESYLWRKRLIAISLASIPSALLEG